MKIYLLPKTRSGMWSVGLCIAFIILISLKMRSVGILPIPTFAIAALGLVGFVIGITAIIRRDRAALIFLPILVGLVIILWIAAEIAYPH